MKRHRNAKVIYESRMVDVLVAVTHHEDQNLINKVVIFSMINRSVFMTKLLLRFSRPWFPTFPESLVQQIRACRSYPAQSSQIH